MTAMRTTPRTTTLAAATLVALLTGCLPSTMIPAGQLTPVRARITDEAIARDLAIFDSYERRLSAAAPDPSGAQRYLANRAGEYVRIAREAYERNDRTDFVDDALSWAAADIEALERGGVSDAVLASAVPIPKGAQRVNEALWAKADELRRAGGAASLGDVALAEGQLMRAGHSFLGGPACIIEPPSVAATRLLDDAERNRQTGPAGPAATPTPAQPTPTPTPATPPATPPARTDCASPGLLAGVPSIVHFALDKSFLAPETKLVLDALVEKVGPYGGVRVTLSGHTDIRASDSYNQALSERRVAAVRDYLLSKGMNASRMTVQAFGERRTLTRGVTRMDHARNRRVAITYTLCDGSEVGPVEQLNDIQLEAIRRAREAAREK